MQSVYTIQGSASPKGHRDAEDEISMLQKSFVELLGHQQGHHLFRMIQEAPHTFVSDDRPMVQRLVRAIERYRAGALHLDATLDCVRAAKHLPAHRNSCSRIVPPRHHLCAHLKDSDVALRSALALGACPPIIC